MSTMFGVQKLPIFGSFGEFAIGDSPNSIRAKYILTKIRPGNDGSWECELASQMRPWREVFDVEELNFDELLQRDLDDSRVAHDLIPYLLGTSGGKAKFFPPILAVIVPRKEDEAGIEPYYPTPEFEDASIEKYGELFDFEQMKWDEKLTPLAKLNYNRQRSAFIIVDGQHRAMAVLALHRQMNSSWANNAFESYYSHISVTPAQAMNIELPTCILYFPDLHEGNPEPREQGIDLSSVCREIFLVVNRSAKRVSESRGLLLDDEDIAARIMRGTLSALKNRDGDQVKLARVYAISYGDSDTEIGHKEVTSGSLEYSSAITLHKIHRAISFGVPEAFKLGLYADISDGRRTRNSNRPPEILLETDVQEINPLRHNSGKSLPPDQVDEVVERLGELADLAVLSLFDRFRPFEIHNRELQHLKTRLSDPTVRAEVEQKKTYALIFEGSGVRNVFESHFERLKDEMSGREDGGHTAPGHLQSQIEFCESVKSAFDSHERIFQKHRACSFFNISYEIFYGSDSADSETQKDLEDKARKLFQTLATQAFQLGYAMAIFTVVEELKREEPSSSSFPYQERRELVKFVTDAYLTALNEYFSPDDNAMHRRLTGYIKQPRASVFDSDALGLRGLLKMSVDELNERQWRFFRYAILEIVHSKYCWNSAQETMIQTNSKWAARYGRAIPKLVAGIISEREKFIDDAVKAALNDSKFKMSLVQQRAHAEGEGKSSVEIELLDIELNAKREADTRKEALNHLKASLRHVEMVEEDMVSRLSDGL